MCTAQPAKDFSTQLLHPSSRCLAHRQLNFQFLYVVIISRRLNTHFLFLAGASVQKMRRALQCVFAMSTHAGACPVIRAS